MDDTTASRPDWSRLYNWNPSAPSAAMDDTTDALLAFVNARLNEREQAARAAPGEHWRYAGGDTVGAWTVYDGHWSIATMTTYDTKTYDYKTRMPGLQPPPDYIDPDAVGQHIALNGPAQVLAEVESERALIAETIRPYLGADTTTGRVAWIALRILAVPYASHADYREEWRP